MKNSTHRTHRPHRPRSQMRQMRHLRLERLTLGVYLEASFWTARIFPMAIVFPSVLSVNRPKWGISSNGSMHIERSTYPSITASVGKHQSAMNHRQRSKKYLVRWFDHLADYFLQSRIHLFFNQPTNQPSIIQPITNHQPTNHQSIPYTEQAGL